MPKNTAKSGLFPGDEAATEAPGAAPAGDEVARFEDALGELESIVEKMERGDLKLEESLQLFERGVGLTRQCRTSLETAELKVKNLLAADDAADAS
ncbi:exodeoxyribonuclease VII small subunit [Hydrocarboniphaga sp.]|uniref:exodeoxyribonuclease VII small subunit n=1 Tax=Hydrocarboniphaga sp. TaxID=2033016 RepID=UPI003D11B125